MGLGLIHGGDVTADWDATATPESGDAAPHQLGEEAITRAADGIGYKYWVFVENPVAGAPIVIGAVCKVAAGGANVILTAPAAGAPHMPAQLAGVAQQAVAVGRRFWALREGRGVILIDGAAVIAGDSLISSNAVPGAAEEAVLGTTDYATIAVARATIADTVVGAADIKIK